MRNNLSGKRLKSLLGAMLITDFKIRYQGSVLGYLWSLVRPISLFVILYIVFARFFKVGTDIPHFGAYLLLGVMLWSFFAEATSNALGSLVEKGDLIRKVKVPRFSIVLVAVLSAATNFAINLIVVLAIIYIAGAEQTAMAILILPLVLLELIVITVCIGLFLSVLYVKYRDVKYIWELFLQVAFYATPVIYPLTRIPEKYHMLLATNPMMQIIQDLRYVLVTNHTITSWEILGLKRSIAWVAVLLTLCAISLLYFKKNISGVAENI